MKLNKCLLNINILPTTISDYNNIEILINTSRHIQIPLSDKNLKSLHSKEGAQKGAFEEH